MALFFPLLLKLCSLEKYQGSIYLPLCLSVCPTLVHAISQQLLIEINETSIEPLLIDGIMCALEHSYMAG